MKKRLFRVAILTVNLTALFSMTVYAAEPSAPHPSSLNPTDRAFILKAEQDNLAELQTIKLAQKKSKNTAVQTTIQQYWADHTQASNQLKQLLPQLGLTVPTTLDAKHQATYHKLAVLSGKQFDKAFAKAQAQDHQQDVAAFKHELAQAKNPQVKQYAETMLPVLQKHLLAAKSLESKV